MMNIKRCFSIALSRGPRSLREQQGRVEQVVKGNGQAVSGEYSLGHSRRGNGHDSNHDVEQCFERSRLCETFLVGPQNLEELRRVLGLDGDRPSHGHKKLDWQD